MDAIVTIQVLDGKKTIGTIEKAVEIHPAIANEIKDIPGLAGEWILSNARARIIAEGAEWSNINQEPADVEQEAVDAGGPAPRGHKASNRRGE